MRWKGAAAPHSVCGNCGGLLFFIVIFYRCLRETIEIDCAPARPQVAAAGLKGCGRRRSRWRRGGGPRRDQGNPKVAARRSPFSFSVIFNGRRGPLRLVPPPWGGGGPLRAERSSRPPP